MGWTHDGDHEGYVALILDDGREDEGTAGTGVLVTATDADRAAGYEHPDSDHYAVIPWERVALWRVQCTCGWTGGMRPAHTEYSHGMAWRDCPQAIQDEVFLPQWEAHVAPFTALGDLRDLSEQRDELDTQIDLVAPLARAGGATWAEIGATLGISKQAAQQRWGKVDGTVRQGEYDRNLLAKYYPPPSPITSLRRHAIPRHAHAPSSHQAPGRWTARRRQPG